MSYSGLTEFIDKLRENDQLLEIPHFVNPELEITEITDRCSKLPGGGKALLFSNNGTQFPLLINALGSQTRMNLALGIENSDEFQKRIDTLFRHFSGASASWIDKIKMLPKIAGLGHFLPRRIKGQGSCQQVVHHKPDLSQLPILKCWPHDGGKFITLPVVHTIDPDTGVRNVGMYRMQQMTAQSTGMHWHRHKVGARHFEAYKRKKQRMPVSVILGGDPVYTYAATAPAPDNFDEYIIAGFIRKKPVKLVKSITNDIFIPADADIVIEGYIDPEEEFVKEGPFGDHTGFYSLADMYPHFHITCITHRRKAVYPATIVGIPPMEDAFMGEISEKLFLKPLQLSVAPEVKDMHMPVAGVVHNLLIVAADIQYPGQAFKIANALWGAGQMMFTKFIVVVDHNVNVRNYAAVLTQIMHNTDFEQDILTSKGPLDVLDHAGDRPALGGKMCFDATHSGHFHDKLPLINDLEREFNWRRAAPGLLFVFTSSFENTVSSIGEKYKGYRGIVIIVEKELAQLNNYTIAWYVLGNTDAIRDIQIGKQLLIVDGMRKHNRKGFSRPWPDLVVMDNDTIENVDHEWKNYNIGKLIDSPSLKIKPLAVEKGAELSH